MCAVGAHSAHLRLRRNLVNSARAEQRRIALRSDDASNDWAGCIGAGVGLIQHSFCVHFPTVLLPSEELGMTTRV